MNDDIRYDQMIEIAQRRRIMFYLQRRKPSDRKVRITDEYGKEKEASFFRTLHSVRASFKLPNRSQGKLFRQGLVPTDSTIETCVGETTCPGSIGTKTLRDGNSRL